MAAVLVFRHLGTKPLWLDEAAGVSIASRPVLRLVSVLPHRDANAGLYYLVLHVWLHLGHGAAWDRGISALSFVATAGLATWVGFRWRGPWAGVAAGLLVATNPFLLFYGQEARPYAPAVLLAVASTAALVGRDGRPAPRAYVVLTSLLLYTDLFAALFVAAQGVVAYVVHRRRGTDVPAVLVRCWIRVLVITAPVWLLMLTVERSQIAWIGRPTAAYFGHTVHEMAGSWPALVLMAGLVVLAVASSDRLVVAVLVASCIVPPIALWLVSQVVPSFVDRYVICSTVALLALVVLGLDVVPHRARLSLLAAVVCLGVLGVARVEGARYKYENPPAVVAFIRARVQPGDAIGFGSGGLRTVIDDYVPKGRAFPADVALAPGGEAWRQSNAYARELPPSELAARLAGFQRLWLITDPTDHGYPSSGPFSSLRLAVRVSYRVVTTAQFPGVDVTLLSQ